MPLPLELTPSLVGKKLSRLFGFSKATYKARFGVSIGIEHRCDDMTQLLDLKNSSEIQMTLNKNNHI